MSLERIAAIEERITAEREKASEVVQRLESVEGKLDQVITTLDRQKGFIAGAMFVLLPIWSGVLLFAKAAWGYINAKGGDV